MAIDVATDERPFSWTGAANTFAQSYAGGILVGGAVALLLVPIRRRLPEPLLHSALSVATPFGWSRTSEIGSHGRASGRTE
ncbi:hypothetical protein ACFCX0_39030 [Streptomyces sp. NPDC056352]|uniref:hypothetical protein n=1 Tax=Streptomyces sp. NPDC056352 TaxID=3345791 RepID=UPI0035D8A83A